jgi:2-polyprenyl-6-methoxyphenol hydroxylase-like FAD-dependent oxidoreductase
VSKQPVELEADVVIVGGGPVGMTLACDLSLRSVKVLLIEQRGLGEPPSVKCNHVSARSMESFRRLGLAERLRAAGLPEDFPNDVAFRTTLNGTELGRIRIPCRRDRYTSRDGEDSWWPTPEPPHRINQIYLEPVLAAHVTDLPDIEMLNNCTYVACEQDDDGVRVDFEDRTRGPHTVRARYLVGCDGGSSSIRKAIGARLEGTPVIQRVQSTLIRCPQLLERMPGERAWCYYAVNPRRCGTVFAIDGDQLFLVHNHLNPGEEGFEAVDRDWSIRTILGIGEDVAYEVVSKEDWTGRRLVADRFRDRRIFICGDAAHLWVPYAGYGMNAGIADALNLSWLLGARLAGWAPASILDAYEAERQPITEQVSHFAMNHAAKMIRARQAVPAEMEDDSPEGKALRHRIGEEYYRLNLPQFCAAGLNFGYFYDSSPIIAYDGERPPAYSMGSFQSSTAPGCRAPHFWLSDGRSLYDAFGSWYTLLRFDADADPARLLHEAARLGVPVKLLDIEPGRAPAEYRHALVLCRCDQHVVWRGDRVPEDVPGLLAVLRGAAPTGRALVGGEDVDHEDQGVGALDAYLRGPGGAVTLGRRDDKQHAAADGLADKAGVPALDDLALADRDGQRRLARPGGVEDLSGPPVHPGVLGRDLLALLDDRSGALDQGLDLQGGRRVGLSRNLDSRAGRAVRRRRGHAGQRASGVAGLRARDARGAELREHVDHEHQRVGAADAGLRVARGAEAVLGRDHHEHPGAKVLTDERGRDRVREAGGPLPDEQRLRSTGVGGAEELVSRARPVVCGVVAAHALRGGHLGAGARDDGLGVEVPGPLHLRDGHRRRLVERAAHRHRFVGVGGGRGRLGGGRGAAAGDGRDGEQGDEGKRGCASHENLSGLAGNGGGPRSDTALYVFGLC